MQFFVDFLPVVIFFIVYKLNGIYAAVVATAITSCITVGYTWFRLRRLETLQIASLVIICVAAALTLLFNDDSFIKWKPTLINGLFAVVFAGSLFTQRSLAERLFARQIACPPPVWKKMTLSWVFFFVVCAAANYYVAFIYQVDSTDLNAEQYQNWQTVASDDQLFADLIYQKPLEALEDEQKLTLTTLSPTDRKEEYLRIIHQSRWVDFKLFGLLALTIAFVLGQGFFIAKYFDQDEKTKVQPGDNLRNTL